MTRRQASPRRWRAVGPRIIRSRLFSVLVIADNCTDRTARRRRGRGRTGRRAVRRGEEEQGIRDRVPDRPAGRVGRVRGPRCAGPGGRRYDDRRRPASPVRRGPAGGPGLDPVLLHGGQPRPELADPPDDVCVQPVQRRHAAGPDAPSGRARACAATGCASRPAGCGAGRGRRTGWSRTWNSPGCSGSTGRGSRSSPTPASMGRWWARAGRPRPASGGAGSSAAARSGGSTRRASCVRTGSAGGRSWSRCARSPSPRWGPVLVVSGPHGPGSLRLRESWAMGERGRSGVLLACAMVMTALGGPVCHLAVLRHAAAVEVCEEPGVFPVYVAWKAWSPWAGGRRAGCGRPERQRPDPV